MSASFISLINALGWTLIYSLWQALLISFILRILLIALHGVSARVKYLLSVAALAGIMLCVAITFISQCQYQQERVASFITYNLVDQAIYIPLIKDPVDAFWAVPDMGILLSWVDGLYMIGLMVFSGKLIRDVFALLLIRKSRIRSFDPAWEKHLAKLASDWGITRQVKLYLSELIPIPVVMGYLKPVIYLPFSMVNNLTSDQIEAILLHELAHIKRNDFLFNIFQTIVETLLFFNPFVWWISKSIRRERENCCDDLVIASTEPALYAKALLAISEEMLLTGKDAPYKGKFVLAAVNKKQELFYRIKRMMENKTKKLNVMQRLLVLLMLSGCVFSIAWLAPGKVDSKKAAPLTAQSSREQVNTVLSPDTSRPAPPPSSLPVAPPPPAPKMNVAPPPPPPAPPRIDSLRGDSVAIATWSSPYYASPDWKKYQQELQDYGKKMQEYFNNDQWKAYQQEMAEYARKMKQQFTGPEWEKYRSEMAGWAKKIAKDNQAKFTYFQDEAWKQRLDNLNQNISKLASNRAHLNALRASSNKERQESLARLSSDIARLAGNGHEVDPHQLVNRLSFDGLLKGKENYKVRLDQKGLYINGKKQDEKYYDRYKNMIGDNTTVKIEKRKGSFKSSISSKSND